MKKRKEQIFFEQIIVKVLQMTMKRRIFATKIEKKERNNN